MISLFFSDYHVLFLCIGKKWFTKTYFRQQRLLSKLVLTNFFMEKPLSYLKDQPEYSIKRIENIYWIVNSVVSRIYKKKSETFSRVLSFIRVVKISIYPSHLKIQNKLEHILNECGACGTYGITRGETMYETPTLYIYEFTLNISHGTDSFVPA